MAIFKEVYTDIIDNKLKLGHCNISYYPWQWPQPYHREAIWERAEKLHEELENKISVSGWLVNSITETFLWQVKDLDIENGSGYLLEISVPGYLKEELVIMVEKQVLAVTSKKSNTFGKTIAFSRKLDEYDIIKSAKYENGVLSIVIHKEVPEEKKPKVINIE